MSVSVITSVLEKAVRGAIASDRKVDERRIERAVFRAAREQGCNPEDPCWVVCSVDRHEGGSFDVHIALRDRETIGSLLGKKAFGQEEAYTVVAERIRRMPFYSGNKSSEVFMFSMSESFVPSETGMGLAKDLTLFALLTAVRSFGLTWWIADKYEYIGAGLHRWRVPSLRHMDDGCLQKVSDVVFLPNNAPESCSVLEMTAKYDSIDSCRQVTCTLDGKEPVESSSFKNDMSKIRLAEVTTGDMRRIEERIRALTLWEAEHIFCSDVNFDSLRHLLTDYARGAHPVNPAIVWFFKRVTEICGCDAGNASSASMGILRVLLTIARAKGQKLDLDAIDRMGEEYK